MVGFWKEYTVVKSHFYHIMAEDTCYPHEVTGDVNLAHLGKVAFARCLLCKVTFLFPSSFYQKWVTWYNQLSVWGCSGIKLPPKKNSIYVYYWTSSVRKIVPFSPICLCVYIFIHSFIYLDHHGLVYFILCLYLFQLWPWGTLSDFWYVPTLFSEYFLTFRHYKMLQAHLVFSPPQL